MYPGFTFVSRTGSDGHHLWVVISDPFRNSGEVLAVNLSSVGGRFDDLTCVLNAGDHEWIVRPTYVRYASAYTKSDAHFDRLLKSSTIRQHEDASPELLAKIRSGASTAGRLLRKFHQLLLDQGLI